MEFQPINYNNTSFLFSVKNGKVYLSGSIKTVKNNITHFEVPVTSIPVKNGGGAWEDFRKVIDMVSEIQEQKGEVDTKLQKCNANLNLCKENIIKLGGIKKKKGKKKLPLKLFKVK